MCIASEMDDGRGFSSILKGAVICEAGALLPPNALMVDARIGTSPCGSGRIVEVCGAAKSMRYRCIRQGT